MSDAQQQIARGLEKLKKVRESSVIGLTEIADYDDDMRAALLHSQMDDAIFKCLDFRDAITQALESDNPAEQLQLLNSMDEIAAHFEQAQAVLSGSSAQELLETVQLLYAELEKKVSEHNSQTVSPAAATADAVAPTAPAAEQQPVPAHPPAAAPTLSAQESKFVGVLTKYWGDIDPQDELFRIGLSGLQAVKATRKENRLEIVTKDGSPFTWLRETVPESGLEREFIGVAGPRAQAVKFTAAMADELVKVAQMRGWASVRVHGSAANQAQLWLAARKAGVAVENYRPRPEDLQALADWKAAMPGLEQVAANSAADRAGSVPAAAQPEKPVKGAGKAKTKAPAPK